MLHQIPWVVSLLSRINPSRYVALVSVLTLGGLREDEVG